MHLNTTWEKCIKINARAQYMHAKITLLGLEQLVMESFLTVNNWFLMNFYSSGISRCMDGYQMSGKQTNKPLHHCLIVYFNKIVINSGLISNRRWNPLHQVYVGLDVLYISNAPVVLEAEHQRVRPQSAQTSSLWNTHWNYLHNPNLNPHRKCFAFF